MALGYAGSKLGGSLAGVNPSGEGKGGSRGGGDGMTLGDGLGGLASLYGYSQANKTANDQANSLSGMYGQDSPYAQVLRQTMERKDAAGGRRSQYGPREVQLQAALAHLASGNANAIANIRNGQNQMRGQGLAQLMQMMNKSGMTNKIGNGMSNGWNSLQGMFAPSQGIGGDGAQGMLRGWDDNMNSADTMNYFGG
jgi:hypothetical protein